MKLSVALAVALACISSSGNAKETAVPAQFVGHWAGSVESCGSDADDLTLRITARHISFWESEGPIRAAVSRGARELALIVELTDEGETWLATMTFELSADGQRLVDSGRQIVRYRCPASGAIRRD
ncbi:hypothetical protein [Agrilutibacter solisilvae]|uniref:Lysozyme inhibitor n=1 Tax=Agrilutibacter solisilvae TaxID=2763317 RepID=A0A974XX31_9GAMM|nr:hypothetical protein [Lysobacter solisilvae]QSX77417.1 hypothetical protein I8J32_011680 [Lysobacter solisilvae]